MSLTNKYTYTPAHHIAYVYKQYYPECTTDDLTKVRLIFNENIEKYRVAGTTHFIYFRIIAKMIHEDLIKSKTS